MSARVLLHLVQAVVVLVFVRHVTGEARTFSPVKGERPSPTLQLFFLATVVTVYVTFRSTFYSWLAIPGLACFLGSAALFEWARRSIRGKFFSYAYSNDTPEFLFTQGPYAYIRNPFYTSYLLAYAGAALMFPGIVMSSVLVVMTAYLTATAKHEEGKFARSSLAAEYAAYRGRTGRFLPRLRGT